MQHNSPTRQRLIDLSEEKIKDFSAKLTPNISSMLGVRVPLIRGLAKEIAKDDWRNWLNTAESDYMEEVMLQGFVIGYATADINEKLSLLTDFIPKIDNWASCDTVISTLKFTNKNKQLVWDFIQPYLDSKKEFEIRFGVVMILGYFIDTDYIQLAFNHFDNINHDGYYVKMAVAWALSVFMVKYPNETMRYLKNNKLDNFTFNKAIQKMTESFRIGDETKILLKQMKRSGK